MFVLFASCKFTLLAPFRISTYLGEMTPESVVLLDSQSCAIRSVAGDSLIPHLATSPIGPPNLGAEQDVLNATGLPH